MLRSFLLRGLNNMLLILHNQYTSFLAGAGLSKEFFALVVQGSSAVKQSKTSQQASISTSEIRLDLIRLKALTSDSSLCKSTPHKLYISESGEQLAIVILEGKSVKCLRLPAPKIYGVEKGKASKLPPMLNLKGREQVNLDRGLKSGAMLLPSGLINDLEKETQQALSASAYVITDSGFAFANFVAKIEPLIEEDKGQAGMARTTFIVVD